MKQRTIRVSEHLFARMRREAARRRVTLSRITREALVLYLGQARSVQTRELERRP